MLGEAAQDRVHTAVDARVHALPVLARVGLAQVGDLEELLNSPLFRLRSAAIGALAAFGDPGSQRVLEAYYPRSVFPRERRVIESALQR